MSEHPGIETPRLQGPFLHPQCSPLPNPRFTSSSHPARTPGAATTSVHSPADSPPARVPSKRWIRTSPRPSPDPVDGMHRSPLRLVSATQWARCLVPVAHHPNRYVRLPVSRSREGGARGSPPRPREGAGVVEVRVYGDVIEGQSVLVGVAEPCQISIYRMGDEDRYRAMDGRERSEPTLAFDGASRSRYIAQLP